MRLLIRQGQVNSGQGVKKIEMIEALALGGVALPFFGLLLLKNGRKLALTLLRIPLPALTFFCGAVWETYARQEFFLRSDLFFIVPALFLTLFTAWSAHRKLKAR